MMRSLEGKVLQAGGLEEAGLGARDSGLGDRGGEGGGKREEGAAAVVPPAPVDAKP
jgi:hypothetical protein